MAQTIDIAGADAGRQDVLAARAVITFGTGNDISGGATAVTKSCIAVPAGAIVVGGYIRVSDATTANVDIHVGDGDDDNRYADNVDGAAVATTALTLTGYKYTTDDTIDVMVDTASAAAAGQAELYVLYVIDGRAAFVQK